MFDILIFLLIGFFVIESLLEASTLINKFFVVMYDDYEVSVAWERFKLAMEASDPLDMMDMQVMSDMMTVMPKMENMKLILTDLTVVFKDMFLRLILVSICSFRTPVNIIYTNFTNRRFTWSNLALIDISILAYMIYFITVYYDYNTTERLHSSLLMMMADEDDPFNLFALNMMFNADNKEYRFDWMSGGFAALIILKIIMMFQYTT